MQPGRANQSTRPSIAPVELTPETVSVEHSQEEEAGEEEMEDVVDDQEEEEDDDDDDDSPETDRMEPFDTTGLREIGNLASWTVSTAKPGCGVEALRSEDMSLFWQSDGPQPHRLNIHFIRMVSITNIRIYLDFVLDESYTPTRITFLAGTSHHDLIAFAELAFEQPKGWIDVDLTGVGGGRDGNTLRAHLVQMKILENHQNGKDTHVRGLRIYAREEGARRRKTQAAGVGEEMGIGGGFLDEVVDGLDDGWMAEPVLR
ncbi:MAG: anaphase promoting complex subunit doc1 [Peltula sp. TS41687]|nr:MAG: anaphase promoting complex subunit doc1 [Peltula sp. TS41687]